MLTRFLLFYIALFLSYSPLLSIDVISSQNETIAYLHGDETDFNRVSPKSAREKIRDFRTFTTVTKSFLRYLSWLTNPRVSFPKNAESPELARAEKLFRVLYRTMVAQKKIKIHNSSEHAIGMTHKYLASNHPLMRFYHSNNDTPVAIFIKFNRNPATLESAASPTVIAPYTLTKESLFLRQKSERKLVSVLELERRLKSHASTSLPSESELSASDAPTTDNHLSEVEHDFSWSESRKFGDHFKESEESDVKYTRRISDTKVKRIEMPRLIKAAKKLITKTPKLMVPTLYYQGAQEIQEDGSKKAGNENLVKGVLIPVYNLTRDDKSTGIPPFFLIANRSKHKGKGRLTITTFFDRKLVRADMDVNNGMIQRRITTLLDTPFETLNEYIKREDPDPIGSVIANEQRIRREEAEQKARQEAEELLRAQQRALKEKKQAEEKLLKREKQREENKADDKQKQEKAIQRKKEMLAFKQKQAAQRKREKEQSAKERAQRRAASRAEKKALEQAEQEAKRIEQEEKARLKQKRQEKNRPLTPAERKAKKERAKERKRARRAAEQGTETPVSTPSPGLSLPSTPRSTPQSQLRFTPTPEGERTLSRSARRRRRKRRNQSRASTVTPARITPDALGDTTTRPTDHLACDTPYTPESLPAPPRTPSPNPAEPVKSVKTTPERKTLITKLERQLSAPDKPNKLDLKNPEPSPLPSPLLSPLSSPPKQSPEVSPPDTRMPAPFTLSLTSASGPFTRRNTIMRPRAQRSGSVDVDSDAGEGSAQAGPGDSMRSPVLTRRHAFPHSPGGGFHLTPPRSNGHTSDDSSGYEASPEFLGRRWRRPVHPPAFPLSKKQSEPEQDKKPVAEN